MEIFRGLYCPLDGDVFGQIGVGTTDPRVGVTIDVGIEVHYLHQTMDSRIGAAGAQSGNALCSEFAQRGLQLVLNRLTGGLALPTLVPLAVVRDA